MSKTLHNCACGCGTETKGTFAPGHDNRLYGQVIRGERPPSDLDPHVGLKCKWARRTAKAEEQAETTSNGDSYTKVKVGRWTYPIINLTGPLVDGSFEVDFKAKNSNLRTMRVNASALS